jgi:hypothetical protein
MKKHTILLVAISALVVPTALAAAAGAAQAWAQSIPDSALLVTLPFDLGGSLDGAKFRIRVPANWNGTLLVYVQGTKVGAPPPEPLLVPPVLPGSDAPLEGTLLARGYALAASEISPADLQVKAAAQDTHALTTFFRGRVGDPKRVVVWGNSMGGLVAQRLTHLLQLATQAGCNLLILHAAMPVSANS